MYKTINVIKDVKGYISEDISWILFFDIEKL